MYASPSLHQGQLPPQDALQPPPVAPSPHSTTASSNPPKSTNSQSVSKDPIHVVGIPSVHIENNRLIVGSSQSSSPRSYTPLKVLGDGSFGTVWLCDWHGTLPPNTPLSPMQSGNSARPDWVGKRLVAVKRMKKKWEGGWDECQKLKEIESLRAIPFHPNIIPLYDFFLLPATKELYFVFESMEGNLYHLIKIRKGRPLAGGLVSSIFRQIVKGLDHIHSSGYFHRDMKPENVLVTTTGITDYTPLSPIAPPNAPPEKDVVVIIKLADFGLARETKSSPPYTEYVSTRWYRAPEVLLLSTNYSNPVDMWALGTIMAELVNLQPLFPGVDQVDQIARICEVLGDPCEDYYMNGLHMGGGSWPAGIKMAKAVGFAFRKMPPKDFRGLFGRSVPLSLIDCISDLLKYDPNARLTTKQCLQHRYLLETSPSDYQQPSPTREAGQVSPQSTRPMQQHGISHQQRGCHPYQGAFPPSHPPSYPSRPGQHAHRQEWDEVDDPMDGSTGDYPQNGHPMDIHVTEPDSTPSQGSKLPKLTIPFGKKHSKWSLGMFGGDRTHQNGLPPVQEVQGGASSSSTPSLKRTQSSSSDSRSLREPSPPREADIKKMNRKEAERVQREAEKQRRDLAKKNHREQARAVMQKRNQLHSKRNEIEWSGRTEQRTDTLDPYKGTTLRPPTSREAQSGMDGSVGKLVHDPEYDSRRDYERMTKIRRTEYEDDQSISSSDVHSTGRMSTLSFASVASVDSDPGPSRIRNRPSLFGISRMQSASSLRTSFDDFPPSARSSNSFSLEGQLATDFRLQASVNHQLPQLRASMSPPPMQILSLSPSGSPSLSPSPPWVVQQDMLGSRRDHAPPYYNLTTNAIDPHKRSSSPYDFNGQANGKADINPIFKVPPPPPPDDEDDRLSSPATSLPPFSELDAVAGGYDYPLSPMSFIAQSDDYS